MRNQKFKASFLVGTESPDGSYLVQYIHRAERVCVRSLHLEDLRFVKSDSVVHCRSGRKRTARSIAKLANDNVSLIATPSHQFDDDDREYSAFHGLFIMPSTLDSEHLI